MRRHLSDLSDVFGLAVCYLILCLLGWVLDALPAEVQR